jgi:DNA-binding CsgD family transcriptional regulator
MPTLSGLPWPKIHDFLAEVGAQRTIQDFKQTAMKKISELIPFDTAAMWFEMDINRPLNLCDNIGVSKNWVMAHNSYYYQLSPIFCDLFSNKFAFCEWDTMPDTEYHQDFIKPQGTRYGGGFFLYDSQRKPALCLCLADSKYNYQQHEWTHSLMEVVQLHLDNYYSFLNLIPQLPSSNFLAAELAPNCNLLSKREAEIAALLCKRLHASQIGSLLLISPQTVYRHIANIYEKLKVRSRRQLLLKLLGKQKEL